MSATIDTTVWCGCGDAIPEEDIHCATCWVSDGPTGDGLTVERLAAAFRVAVLDPSFRQDAVTDATILLAALASPATEEYPDEGDPGPFAEGIAPSPATEEVER